MQKFLSNHPLRTDMLTADTDGLARAATLLRAGRLVAFPTETVYGLGADARSGEAVAGIFEAKGRPRFNPLIAHVPTIEAAMAQGRFDEDALALATAFWPGPLTLVVPAADACTVSDLARAGLRSVALRVPAHPVALALLRAVDMPIAAPSANRSGRISPTLASHIAADLSGRIDLILDGGPTQVGIESTIIACREDGPCLLRPGGTPRQAIERVIGRALADPAGPAILAPGMMESHYAPSARVRLNATAVESDEAVLDFGGQLGPGQSPAYLDLSRNGRLEVAAANLFGFLHRLDRSGATTIAVAAIPPHGLGEAINDRLARAATPRH